jgi:CheY-like chemotaxis protein
MVLQNFGYTVTTLRRAEEALEFLAVALPSLVITEIGLDGMSGLDLLRKIKANPSTDRIPVIIQTAGGTAETRNICLREGCALFLKKPVSGEDIYRAVQASIEETPRKNIRIRTLLKAAVSGDVDPGRQTGEEFITVLSEEGMYVRTLSLRPINTRHTVRFALSHRLVTAEAVVLYHGSFAEGRETGMGMKFVLVSSGDRTLIREFISEQVRKGLAVVLDAEQKPAP